jgi:hypothetical protein
LKTNWAVSGFKGMVEVIGYDVRISNYLTIRFQLQKIIFPFKFGKIFSIIIIIIIITGHFRHNLTIIAK